MSWLVFYAACGYRTAPVPYDRPEESIQTVTHAKLNKRGDNWVFRWKVPEGQLLDQPPEEDEQSMADASADISRVKKSAISIFRINILRSSGECPLCEPESIGRFLINLNSGNIESAFPPNIKLPPYQRFFIIGDRDFQFDLPITFFTENGLIERGFYTIDYILNSGLLSVPSQKLYSLDLKTIPPPTVHIRTSVSINPPQQADPEVTSARSGNLPLKTKQGPENSKSIQNEPPTANNPDGEISNEPQRSFFLLLRWNLQQETLRHTRQKDGRFNEQVVYYGVNFYSNNKFSPPLDKEEAKPDPFTHTERLINPVPLLYGSFSLLNFQGQLLARQVDRFGNESESILVFNGQY